MLGKTITDRMNAAIKTVGKIRWFKYSYSQKAALIRTAVLPKALHCCEPAPVCERTLQKLRSAIADVICPHSQHKSVGLAYHFASHGSDLDPGIHILSRRITMLRRMSVKHNKVLESTHKVQEVYREEGLTTKVCVLQLDRLLHHLDITGEPGTGHTANRKGP